MVTGQLNLMKLPDYFQQQAAYHAWATQRLLNEHVCLLTDADYHRRAGLFFGSVHGTLNHLLVAETIWQARFISGKSPVMALNTELETDRGKLTEALSAASTRWADWINGNDLTEQDEMLHYNRSDGQATSLPYAQTLGHVFNHATHYRGQVTAALTAMGSASPELDWVRLLQLQAAA
jgi:uncharacterized damage-inducible protein DinB